MVCNNNESKEEYFYNSILGCKSIAKLILSEATHVHTHICVICIIIMVHYAIT